MFWQRSLDAINRTHGLALRKQHIVTVDGMLGRIVGVEGDCIKIRLDGGKKPALYHPLDRAITYAEYIEHVLA